MRARLLLIVLLLVAAAGLVAAWIGFAGAPEETGGADAGLVLEPRAAEDSALEVPDAGQDGERERVGARMDRGRGRGTEANRLSVRGWVLDAHGAPIPGATLVLVTNDPTLVRWEDGGDGRLVESASVIPGRSWRAHFGDRSAPSTSSSAAGEFVLNAWEPGAGRIEAMATGYEPAVVELALDAPRTDVLVRLERTPVAIVNVSWPAARPAEGVRVEYGPVWWESHELLPTDRGTRRWSHVVKAELVDASRRVQSAARSDANGNAELATPALALRNPEWKTWFVLASARRRIEADQGFELPEESRSQLRGRELTWRGEATGTGPVPHALHVGLLPGAALHGRVVDQHAAPIADVELSARIAADVEPLALEPARSDARGDYFLDAQRLGRHRITIMPPDAFEGRELEVELDHVLTRRDLVLARRPTLAGVIRDPFGNPRPHARITVVGHGEEPPAARLGRKLDARERESGLGIALGGEHNRNAIADDEGRFRIERVPLGWAQLVASGEGAFASAPLEVLVVGDEDQLDLALRLRRGAAVVVEARAKDGTPLARRRMHVLPEGDEKPAHQLVTDASGVVRLKSLTPGRWTFRLLDGETNALEVEPATSSAPAAEPIEATVELPEGATTTVTLDG